MPSWSEVLNEISENNINPLDKVRRKYLSIMNKYTGRNIITYYSAFLQKDAINSGIDENDKNAFMQVINGLDKSKGLDLILHTPGGDIAATESIINYLHSIFGNDIRAFIPQISMSAGTMIALSCKEIIMGKESSIGPIDPQFGGVSCGGVIEEFEKAKQDIKIDPSCIALWQTIIGKYHPTFLGDCEKAIIWSKEIVKKQLIECMFEDEKNKEDLANKVVNELASHQKTYSHSRHIHLDECRKLNIKVKALEDFEHEKIEDCNDLQDCVLTIHHANMQSLSNSNAVKIIENHNGNAMIINGIIE